MIIINNDNISSSSNSSSSSSSSNSNSSSSSNSDSVDNFVSLTTSWYTLFNYHDYYY